MLITVLASLLNAFGRASEASRLTRRASQSRTEREISNLPPYLLKDIGWCRCDEKPSHQ